MSTAKIVLKFDLTTGAILKEYPSGRAVRDDGFSPGQVSKCCSDPSRRSHNEYGCAFKSDGVPVPSIKPREPKSKRVVSYNVHTLKDIKVYDSMVSTKGDGFSPAKVSECCLGNQDTHGKLGWRFEKNNPRKVSLPKNEARRVARCDMETFRVLKTYDSLNSIDEDPGFNFDKRNIGLCLINKRQSHGGFIWKYAESDNSDVSGIYSINSVSDKEKVYIGSSIDIPKRWMTHKSDLRRGAHKNRYLQNTYDKHGENCFEYKVVESCHPDARKDLEQHYIDTLNPVYNIVKKVDSFPPTNKPVIRYDLKTEEELEDYVSGAAAEEAGYNKVAISRCCNGVRFSHKNFGWKFADGSTVRKEIGTRYGKAVISYEPLTGKDVEQYDNISAAMDEGFDQSKISNCCRGKRETHAGLGWRFEDEEARIFEKVREIKAVEKVCLDTGEILKFYENAYRAKADGFNPNLIRLCLYGNRREHKGFGWRYVGETAPIRSSKSVRSSGVRCYDGDTLIKIYKYFAQVKEDGFSPSKVSECCKGKRKTHGSLRWQCD